ncbi:PTS transporter subunit EIIC [Nonomuraea dietziae]|uniref:PTS system N-acetylglucosamine-specific IIC component n=1 Tax=Nonomuraea dietziae TaxID=65515 RepID=A0A7W5YRY3_9ACTN|nr:PTS transporter subunit EIIC [Nonomuraea dietziae]MBB3728244.1 PTS system N-acetylglucosamine-specific IIC component [Nonomuraea dietziae]
MSTASAEGGTSFWSSAFAVLQRVGRSLMMPIAVLPAAGLLLRFGQEDLLGRSDNALLDKVASVFAAAGGALFDNLPLLFAIGVAIGFAKKADGSTALAALVGYLVFDQVTRRMFFDSSAEAVKSKVTLTLQDGSTVINQAASSQPTGVLGGIMIGLVAAVLWQRYYRIRLPSWLAFFGGRRFVQIVTAVTALALGVIFGLVWPPIGTALTSFGDWLATHSALGAGVYGVANRLLIPLGLHHFVNSIVWTVIPECTVNGVQAAGDLKCYAIGQDGAGIFMTGFFPVLMFGVPGAALAIWRAAPSHKRAAVGSIMVGGALTAFVTGITEPVEFAFIFVAPMLFVVHALLTGVSMALMAAMDTRLGFSFSAGGIDMLLNATKSNTHGLVLIILIGLAYFVVYYLLFSFLIRRLDILTPGREPDEDTVPPGRGAGSSE